MFSKPWRFLRIVLAVAVVLILAPFVAARISPAATVKGFYMAERAWISVWPSRRVRSDAKRFAVEKLEPLFCKVGILTPGYNHTHRLLPHSDDYEWTVE